jgi:hypothetical protein
MALDQPLLGVPPLEFPEGLDQIDDGGEVADPQQDLFEGPDEAFRDAFALGLPDEARELTMPRKTSSAWKSSLMEALPWSWRIARPTAMPLSKPPKCLRTP